MDSFFYFKSTKLNADMEEIKMGSLFLMFFIVFFFVSVPSDIVTIAILATWFVFQIMKKVVIFILLKMNKGKNKDDKNSKIIKQICDRLV